MVKSPCFTIFWGNVPCVFQGKLCRSVALSKPPSSGTDAAQEATILGRVDFNREKWGISPTQHGDFVQQNTVFFLMI
jgi:hypothetical protein